MPSETISLEAERFEARIRRLKAKFPDLNREELATQFSRALNEEGQDLERAYYTVCIKNSSCNRLVMKMVVLPEDEVCRDPDCPHADKIIRRRRKAWMVSKAAGEAEKQPEYFHPRCGDRVFGANAADH